MTATEILVTFASSAVVVKVLDKGYDICAGWINGRKREREQSRAEQIIERADSRRLTLDEVRCVITSQQEEIKRLGLRVTELDTAHRACEAQYATLSAEVTDLREQAARNGELEKRYYNLQVKFQEMLKEMAEFMAGVRGVATKDA